MVILSHVSFKHSVLYINWQPGFVNKFHLKIAVGATAIVIFVKNKYYRYFPLYKYIFTFSFSCPYFSLNKEQVWEAGSPVQSLYSSAATFSHCLVKKYMDVLGRCHFESNICCSKISIYFPALMQPSHKSKWPLPRGLILPLIY